MRRKSQHFIDKLDIFGVKPELQVDGQNQFKTKCGSFMSFILLSCFSVAMWVYGREIFEKKNPVTTFTEKLSQDPERYNLTKNNFNIAFGLQNMNGTHFFDEEIYTLRILQPINEKIKQDDGQYKNNLVYKPHLARKCKAEDFTIDTEFFLKSDYKNMYCLDSQDELFIQGDFESELFSNLVIDFLPCKEDLSQNKKCKSQKIIQDHLSMNYWALYFTDQILNPKDHENPFQMFGRSMYGVSSQNSFKQKTFFFKNSFLEDNIGVFFDQFQEKRGIHFSREYETGQPEPFQDKTFLRITLRLDKFKASVIYRQYLNIASVLAQVGGIMQVIHIIFMIIAMFISKELFNIKLLNQIFHIDKVKQTKKKQQQKSKQKLKFGFHAIQQHIPFKKLNNQSETYQTGMDHIKHYLNIKTIIKKLIEIDQLKLLLLDQNQRKLFDFMQKPIISIQDTNTSQNNSHNDEELYSKNIGKEQQKERETYNDYILENNDQAELDSDICDLIQDLNTQQSQNIVTQKLLTYLDYSVLNSVNTKPPNLTNNISPITDNLQYQQMELQLKSQQGDKQTQIVTNNLSSNQESQADLEILEENFTNRNFGLEQRSIRDFHSYIDKSKLTIDTKNNKGNNEENT